MIWKKLRLTILRNGRVLLNNKNINAKAEKESAFDSRLGLLVKCGSLVCVKKSATFFLQSLTTTKKVSRWVVRGVDL
jgi:hypothetical protein